MKWRIVVEGEGPATGGSALDADRLAARAVGVLQQAGGQRITSAAITVTDPDESDPEAEPSVIDISGGWTYDAERGVRDGVSTLASVVIPGVPFDESLG